MQEYRLPEEGMDSVTGDQRSTTGEPEKQHQGPIATQDRSCETRHGLLPLPFSKHCAGLTRGKHKDVTHASSPGRDSLVVAGSLPWLMDRCWGIAAGKPGTGQSHHSFMERGRLLK